MKMNLKVLNEHRSEILYEKDMFGLIEHMFEKEDPFMVELDVMLAQAQRRLGVEQLIKEHGADAGLELLIGENSVKLISSTEAQSSAWSRLQDSMDTFAKKLTKVFFTKAVSERYIYSRFEKLKTRLDAADMQRANVSKVPSYEEATKRFIGALAVADFLDDISKKNPDDPIFQDTLFNKLEVMSNGVLAIAPANKDSGLKNLIWNPPKLSEYDVLGSPWNNNVKREQMRNLIVKLKYQGADSIKSAIKNIKKLTEKHLESNTYGQDDGYGTDDGYGSQPMGYDNNSHAEKIKAYSASFLLTRLCKQAHQNAIEKEINIFCITYIQRLCSYKDI